MNDQAVTLLGACVAALLSLGCLAAAMRRERRWRLIHDLPTSKTTGVFIGLVEVTGTVRADQPLVSFLAERPCAWYRWSVEEHWSRTVIERYTDAKGNSQTRVREESGWTTIASGGDEMPFMLCDDAGEVRVVPEGADIQATQTMSLECSTGDVLYYAKGPADAVGDSDHRRRFTESAIPVGDLVYVIGQARERRDAVAAEIARDALAPLFVISTRGEESVSSGYYWSALGLEVLGLAIAGAAPFILCYRDSHDPLAIGVPVASAMAGYALCWTIGWIWMVYNGLIELRQRVRQAWANIDVQLKRRFDLIPSLLTIVERLRDHERETESEVAVLRSQLRQTPPGRPGPDPVACADPVIALAERYPQLTADRAFQKLMGELRDCEDRIALARAYFNDIVADWNIRIERIPDRFVASWTRMARQEAMAANGFERAAPKVVVS